MTDTERAIQLHLDAYPNDHQARGVLADHLDEIGDERGPGYRCLGHLRKVVTGTVPYFGYWNAGFYEYDHRHHPEHLPEDWFKLAYPAWDVFGPASGPGDGMATVRRDAEDSAAVAFSRLPAARQLELLATAVV